MRFRYTALSSARICACPELRGAGAVPLLESFPINRVEELLPWNVAGHLNQPSEVTEALAA
jgi:hypothetical protein